MAAYTLPFEKPVAELEKRLRELVAVSESQQMDVSGEIALTEQRILELQKKIFAELTPWQRVQVARHPQRPYTLDYLQLMTTEYTELHGDRLYRDDRAILGGFALLGGRRVMVIGTQKGRDTRGNLECNFGCAYPEGYRKALRLMRLAAKFGVPIVTLIDTPGAYPGIESEERHVAEAIAVNLREMFTLPVPIVVAIIGEGGSGGALGIGIGDRVLVMENAYYSVISPEGCAAILWKDRAFADRAAAALKITSRDLLEAGLADEIIPEPLGGAHRNHAASAAALQAAILRNLDELARRPAGDLMKGRYDKFRAMGRFAEELKPARGPRAEGTPAAPAR
jgi:acetyl-CoA carboxylase carboxyl transferase subunit alpha